MGMKNGRLPYAETVNLTHPTDPYAITPGLPIGSKKLIRKVNASQGVIVISCAGETFTRAGLASISLNNDGDFWLIEKVTATRWDLIDGMETGSNVYGDWWCHANGRITLRGGTTDAFSMGSYVSGLYVGHIVKLLPRAVKEGNRTTVKLGYVVDQLRVGFATGRIINSTEIQIGYWSASSSVTQTNIQWEADALWY